MDRPIDCGRTAQRGVVALLAGATLGCTVSATAAQADGGGPAAPTHSNALIAYELRGIVGEDERGVAIQMMMPAVEVQSVPLSFVHDLLPGELNFGCRGDSFDLMSGDLPPDWGDVGTVEVTGHSGEGGGVDSATIASTISCSRSDIGAFGYACSGVPALISEGPIDALQPASFLNDGEGLVFTVSGGPATQERELRRETFGIAPPLKVEGPELAGTGTINMSSGLSIQYSCPGDPLCQEVHMVRFFVSDNPDPFAAPTRYFSEIECAFLPAQGSDTIDIPAEALALLDSNPWEVMVIKVLRVNFPAGTIPGGAATNGKGEFFINYNATQ
jgi:hypothetical protein